MTETIDKLINDIVTERISELRVCLPGRIETYDANTMLANVQPLLKRRFYGRREPSPLPIIARVPVVHPRTQAAIIRLPVNAGDIVTLVFADRSIENWISGDGSEQEPLDKRMHHISDAYAIPGGYPQGRPLQAINPAALEIQVTKGTKITVGNGTDEVIQVTKGTKITVGNGTDEVLQIMHDAATSLKETAEALKDTLADIRALTVTCPGGGGTSSVPLNSTDFLATESTVNTIISDITAELASLSNIKV